MWEGGRGRAQTTAAVQTLLLLPFPRCKVPKAGGWDSLSLLTSLPTVMCAQHYPVTHRREAASPGEKYTEGSRSMEGDT